ELRPRLRRGCQLLAERLPLLAGLVALALDLGTSGGQLVALSLQLPDVLLARLQLTRDLLTPCGLGAHDLAELARLDLAELDLLGELAGLDPLALEQLVELLKLLVRLLQLSLDRVEVMAGLGQPAGRLVALAASVLEVGPGRSV